MDQRTKPPDRGEDNANNQGNMRTGIDSKHVVADAMFWYLVNLAVSPKCFFCPRYSFAAVTFSNFRSDPMRLDL